MQYTEDVKKIQYVFFVQMKLTLLQTSRLDFLL